MKLINPTGRKVSADILSAGEVQPLACMCSTESQYSASRGNDGCFNCGCSCSSTDFSAGNSKTAFWTIRSSGSTR